MTGVHDVGLFIAAGLLLNVTPGPDMAYIAARGAAGGLREGAAAVLGITAGCMLHTLAAALGLSALLATSAVAFDVVKWCGALYLLYAGFRMLVVSGRRDAPVGTTAPSSPVVAVRAGVPTPRIFREALLINLFNPKVALFFLAFVPQFIATDAPDKPLAFLLLGTLFNVDSLFVNLPVAWLASRAGHRLRSGSRGLRWLKRAVGGLFVLLAVRLATSARD